MENLNAAICTIASKNYLAYVRALAESFRRYHPNVPVHLLLVDRPDELFDPRGEPFTTILLEDLAIPDRAAFCFQYTILELSTAVKPFLLMHLFKTRGFDKILYFDPDIRFYAPVPDLFAPLDDVSVVLIPHLTEPLKDELRPSELDILRSGAYNLGFLGAANTPTTLRLLEWWQEKLLRYCVVNPAEGLFTDQRWMDLAPALFEGVRIIRDPGYDVAYWNLQHRRLECQAGEYRVNGEPLRFYHFSGYRPDRPQVMSKHQDRYGLHDLPGLAELFEAYRQALLKHGFEDFKNAPYAFGFFADGTPIPDFVRQIYRDLGEDARRFGDPFQAGPGSFLAWLNGPAEGTGAETPVMTRLAMDIWRRRSDLQAAYPYPPGKDRTAYAAWLLTMSEKEYGLGRAFLQALNAPEAVSGQAAQAQAAASRLSEKGRRARMTRAMAGLGLGRTARRVLGARLASTLRDWVRWGGAARRGASPEAKFGLGRTGRPAVKGLFGGNVVGYIASESGVGEKARNTIRSMKAAGVPVAAANIDLYSPVRTRDQSCADIPQGNPHSFNIIAVNADETVNTFRRLGAGFFSGKLNIGYWDWEMEQFPEEWRDRFEYVDEVWVPSYFCLDTVSRASPVPVVRIPHSVEVGDIAEDAWKELGLPEDRFVFLFVYDYHSYAERKNPLGVVRAFRKAFGGAEDAHLVLKGTSSKVDPDYHALLEAEAAARNVTLITRYVDRPVLDGLMQRCDCYVSLHRSEGFGLTIAEAMYLGKPVIATAYSGNVDFMRPENSYAVEYALTEAERDYGPYRKGWVWADPDVGHAAELMRHVFEHREEAAQRGARAAQHIRQLYSHQAAGELMKARLQRLWSQYGGQ